MGNTVKKTRIRQREKYVDGRRMVSAKRLAQQTGYNERYIRKLAQDGGLPGSHLEGNMWYFDDEAKGFLRQQIEEIPVNKPKRTAAKQDDYLSEFF